MNRSKLALTVAGLALFLGGLAAGRSLAVMQLTNAHAAAPTPPPLTVPSPVAALPTRDVAGDDIGELPRYPGSVRVEHRHLLQKDMAVVEVEYVTAAAFNDVHQFYRTVFHDHGWGVADFNFIHGEWTFLVVKDMREAIVEIEACGAIVEVEIEWTQPQPAPSPPSVTQRSPAPPAPSTPVAPPPAAPVDDDDQWAADDELAGDDNGGD